MNTKFTVIVNNQSPKDNRFCIFAKAPDVDTADTIDVNIPILAVSDLIPGAGQNGQAKFSLDFDLSAIVTTSLTGQVQATTEESVDIKLGTIDQPASIVEASYQGEPPLKVSDSEEVNSPPGGFVLDTNSFSTPTPNNFSVGLGLHLRDSQDIIPAAYFLADPNTRYSITPSSTFYIAEAGESYFPGKIIKIKSIKSYAPIDASHSQGKRKFMVIFNNENQFVIQQ